MNGATASPLEPSELVELGPQLAAEIVDRRRRLGRLDVLPQSDQIPERGRAVAGLLELESHDQHLLELRRGQDVGDERHRIARVERVPDLLEEVVALLVAVQRAHDLDRHAHPTEVVMQIARHARNGEPARRRSSTVPTRSMRGTSHSPIMGRTITSRVSAQYVNGSSRRRHGTAADRGAGARGAPVRHFSVIARHAHCANCGVLRACPKGQLWLYDVVCAPSCLIS